MIKTVKIDDNISIKMDASLLWVLIYKAQFGRDILPEFMPLLDSLAQLIIPLVENTAGKKNASISDLLSGITDLEIGNAIAALSGLEFTTVLQIIWALAKNADKDIPELEEWIAQFEAFPVDVIIAEAFGIIAKSSMSGKNLNRLLTGLKTLSR